MMAESVNQLNSQDFIKQETLDKYRRYIDYLYEFDLVQDAYYLVRAVPKILGEIDNYEHNYPDLYREYLEVVERAKIVAIPILKEEEIEDIFRNNLLAAISYQTRDIYEKIENKLVGIMVYEDRDEFKDKLRKAMEGNQEFIGKQDIEINNEKKPPTIANWLLEYHTKLGMGDVDKVKIAQYFNENKNINRLAMTDRNLLVKILNLYVRLSISSTTTFGLEEPVSITDDQGNKTVINKGVAEKINLRDEIKKDLEIARQVIAEANANKLKAAGVDKKIADEEPADTIQPKPTEKKEVVIKSPSAEPVETIDKKPPVVVIQDDRLAQAEDDLLRDTAGDLSQLRDKLFTGIKANNAELVIASLLILGRLGGLAESLINDKNLANIYEKNVIPALANDLKTDAKRITATYTPAHLREFLRFILDRALKDEQLAAQFGHQIESVMASTGQADYANMVHYDAQAKKFRWAEAQIDPQGNLQ
ncbi:MAG: hypothetical protein V1838_00240 [Patescibacteria group bacterium]